MASQGWRGLSKTRALMSAAAAASSKNFRPAARPARRPVNAAHLFHSHDRHRRFDSTVVAQGKLMGACFSEPGGGRVPPGESYTGGWLNGTAECSSVSSILVKCCL